MPMFGLTPSQGKPDVMIPPSPERNSRGGRPGAPGRALIGSAGSPAGPTPLSTPSGWVGPGSYRLRKVPGAPAPTSPGWEPAGSLAPGSPEWQAGPVLRGQMGSGGGGTELPAEQGGGAGNFFNHVGWDPTGMQRMASVRVASPGAPGLVGGPSLLATFPSSKAAADNPPLPLQYSPPTTAFSNPASQQDGEPVGPDNEGAGPAEQPHFGSRSSHQGSLRQFPQAPAELLGSRQGSSGLLQPQLTSSSRGNSREGGEEQEAGYGGDTTEPSASPSLTPQTKVEDGAEGDEGGAAGPQAEGLQQQPFSQASNQGQDGGDEGLRASGTQLPDLAEGETPPSQSEQAFKRSSSSNSQLGASQSFGRVPEDSEQPSQAGSDPTPTPLQPGPSQGHSSAATLSAMAAAAAAGHDQPATTSHTVHPSPLRAPGTAPAGASRVRPPAQVPTPQYVASADSSPQAYQQDSGQQYDLSRREGGASAWGEQGAASEMHLQPLTGQAAHAARTAIAARALSLPPGLLAAISGQVMRPLVPRSVATLGAGFRSNRSLQGGVGVLNKNSNKSQ